ncbi:hypothetical protein [Thioalkalivibrio sp.]|uniref:hypothetical protein n=1 Tax=Thioalkalivibrio sp. TaxID=2093813 RepID=UPI003562DBDA
MRNLVKGRFIGAAALLVAISLPTQVNAFFWSGPGCFVANMLGMGNAGGGLRLSIGGGAFGSGSGPAPGYGYQYAYPPPPGTSRRLPGQVPAMPSSLQVQSNAARRARDISRANAWRGGIGEMHAFETGDTNVTPSNRWSRGR